MDSADPAMVVLNDWQARVIERYRSDGRTKPGFGPWREISSDSLRRLFPKLRFITLHWEELPVSIAPGMQASRAGDLYVILAVSSSNEITREFFGYGNYEEFGSLLAHHRVTITSTEDASLVWDAFCDLHQKSWKGQGIVRIDDTTWHLGVITIDRFHYYYRVDLDSEHEVIRGELHADEIKSE